MKDIKKTAFMEEAARSRQHGWPFYILVTLAVYMVGSMLSGIIQIPGMMIYFLQNSDYIQMLRTGDVDMNTVMKLMSNMPEWITILILFSEIFLIIIYCIYCRWLDGRKIRTMGFIKKGFILQYLKGMLLGVLIIGAALGICLLTGSARFAGFAQNTIPIYIVLYFGGYLIQGMAEEVICRGFLFVSLTKKYRVVFSAFISSLFFAALHGFNTGLTPLAFFNLFLFGLLMSFLFVACGNIWVVGALHSIWNFVQGNLFGIQVSGLSQQNSVFSIVSKEGRDLIHGGSFGLEGGLAVLVVLIISLAAVVGYLKKKGKLISIEPVVDNPVTAPLEQPTMQKEEPVTFAHSEKKEPMYTSAGYQGMPQEKSQTDSDLQKETQGPEKTGYDKNYFKD